MHKAIVDTILHEGEWKTSHSSGNGGQNVNKRYTKATFLWNTHNSSLDSDIVNKIEKSYGSHNIAISSQRTRHLQKNKECVVEKIESLVQRAMKKKKKRKQTKKNYAIIQKEKENRMKHSQKKARRRKTVL